MNIGRSPVKCASIAKNHDVTYACFFSLKIFMAPDHRKIFASLRCLGARDGNERADLVFETRAGRLEGWSFSLGSQGLTKWVTWVSGNW